MADYFDPSNPGAFGGVSASKSKGISVKDAQKYLRGQLLTHYINRQGNGLKLDTMLQVV